MPRLVRLSTIFLSLFLLILLIAGCGTQSPTPLPPTPIPTTTPIPGYVAGEEDLAYASFTEYYEANCDETLVWDTGEVNSESFDPTYIGRGVYIGDGIWRFRIGIINTFDHTKYETNHDPVFTEKTLTVRSLADTSWEDPCPYAGTHYPDDERREDAYEMERLRESVYGY